LSVAGRRRLSLRRLFFGCCCVKTQADDNDEESDCIAEQFACQLHDAGTAAGGHLKRASAVNDLHASPAGKEGTHHSYLYYVC